MNKGPLPTTGEGLKLLNMKTIAHNRKASYEFNILEKFEAGIQLTGHEVKSAKTGHMSLGGGRVYFSEETPYLAGVEISSFQPKNTPKGYDSSRPKKLLLKQKEIKYLIGKTSDTSLTIIPIRAYIKNGLVKIEIALAERKKKRDKREQIKKRDIKRDVQREVREQFE